MTPITLKQEKFDLGPGDAALAEFEVYTGSVPRDEGDIGKLKSESALAEIAKLDQHFAAPAYSGLSHKHRVEAKHIVAQYAKALLANPTQVHYTQDAVLRWRGINHHQTLKTIDPFYGDCSSTATFMLWRALEHVHPGIHDLVNGAHWLAGYTGTIATHGKRVYHVENYCVGDLILYGPGPTYEHVTVSLGGRKCFSHGGEAGPFVLDIDYRGDRAMTRRTI